MMRLRTAIFAALLLAPVMAQAQNNYPSAGGATVPTSVAMCVNGSGVAVPVSATCPLVASLSATGANNADAVANVATGLVPTEGFNFVYNGTTWDRARGDTTSGAWVNVKAMLALPAGTALIGKVGFDQTTPGTTNAVAPIAGQAGVQGGAGASTALTQRITIATDANVVDTELAAALAAGDAMANPTTAPVIADNSIWDSASSQWVRWRQALGATGIAAVNTEGTKATYSAAGTVAPAAGATTIITITGSGTKTIRVTRFQVSGVATAATSADVVGVIWSTAASGGTASTRTATPHDSASAAATATVRHYTANPTAGAAVGFPRLQKITLSTPAGSNSIVPLVWDFTNRNSQGIVLRGTAQSFVVDWNAQTIGGNSLNYDIEWTEE